MSLFERMGRRAELCGAMMRRLSIDPVLASRVTLGTMMHGIARTCMLCRHSDECATWLESAPAESTDYRKFCPNADKFDGTRRYLMSCGQTPECDGPGTA